MEAAMKKKAETRDPNYRSRPNPDCKHCDGLGCHPEALNLEPPMWIRVTARGWKGIVVPCPECWKGLFNK